MPSGGGPSVNSGVHLLTTRENRESPESGIYLKNTISNEHPVYNNESILQECCVPELHLAGAGEEADEELEGEPDNAQGFNNKKRISHVRNLQLIN